MKWWKTRLIELRNIQPEDRTLADWAAMQWIFIHCDGAATREELLYAITLYTAGDTWLHVDGKCSCKDRNPDDWEEGIFLVNLPILLTEILATSKMVESKGEAKRLIKGGGIKLTSARKEYPCGFLKNPLEWNVATDERIMIIKLPEAGMLIQKGKKNFIWVQGK